MIFQTTDNLWRIQIKLHTYKNSTVKYSHYFYILCKPDTFPEMRDIQQISWGILMETQKGWHDSVTSGDPVIILAETFQHVDLEGISKVKEKMYATVEALSSLENQNKSISTSD